MLPPVHVIDFEGNRAYGIIEYGLVTLENSQIVAVVCDYCRPQYSPAVAQFFGHLRFPENTALTTFADCLSLFKERRQRGVFCAHNATVEDRLLCQYDFYCEPCPTEEIVGEPDKKPYLSEFTGNTSNLKKFLGPTKDSLRFASPSGTAIKPISWGPWIDTHKIYKKYYPIAKSYGVKALIQHFRLEKKLENLAHKYDRGQKLSFHTALYDALATTLLLQNFIDLFRVNDVQFLL
ncbi:MAG: hypothetical protein LBB11_00180 [Puniceicoccales bacterium]|jgi:DNA polymerase III epsilon subunit-like protein|nr:hypothetical protein [Puniceicoccales bacterium]